MAGPECPFCALRDHPPGAGFCPRCGGRLALESPLERLTFLLRLVRRAVRGHVWYGVAVWVRAARKLLADQPDLARQAAASLAWLGQELEDFTPDFAKSDLPLFVRV